MNGFGSPVSLSVSGPVRVKVTGNPGRNAPPTSAGDVERGGVRGRVEPFQRPQVRHDLDRPDGGPRDQIEGRFQIGRRRGGEQGEQQRGEHRAGPVAIDRRANGGRLAAAEELRDRAREPRQHGRPPVSSSAPDSTRGAGPRGVNRQRAGRRVEDPHRPHPGRQQHGELPATTAGSSSAHNTSAASSGGASSYPGGRRRRSARPTTASGRTATRPAPARCPGRGPAARRTRRTPARIEPGGNSRRSPTPFPPADDPCASLCGGNSSTRPSSSSCRARSACSGRAAQRSNCDVRHRPAPGGRRAGHGGSGDGGSGPQSTAPPRTLASPHRPPTLPPARPAARSPSARRRCPPPRPSPTSTPRAKPC